MKHYFSKHALAAGLLAISLTCTMTPVGILANEMPAEPQQDESGIVPMREGTDVTCSLTLNTMADGTVTDTAVYKPGQGNMEVQVGGTLNLKNVWTQYGLFKTAYILKNGRPAFLSKNLTGSYEYTFKVNPDVVTVNTDIVNSPEAWQQAFEEGSGASAATFFTYMRCTSASYDAATGTVTVGFTIDENGTKKVSMKTVEADDSARPQTIQAYSPKGAFYVEPSKFVTGAVAVPGEASFKGNIDLDPWMALIVPIRFQAETSVAGLKLEVPDGNVVFNIENGTWADGTKDPKTVPVSMAVTMIDGTYQAAGTLDESQVPSGMLADEGFDPATGAWTPSVNTSENGTLLAADGADSAVYTYSFEPAKEQKMIPIFRVYNPNSGEHFYTSDENEKDFLIKAGWQDEGIGWHSPEASDMPVYRVYNPNTGDHHYTMNEKEKDILSTIGWQYEGISWYSLPAAEGIPVYRQYNPNAKLAGSHNFTTSVQENDYLISVGWLGEGIAWFALK